MTSLELAMHPPMSGTGALQLPDDGFGCPTLFDVFGVLVLHSTKFLFEEKIK
jgi:hypothetical protein